MTRPLERSADHEFLDAAGLALRAGAAGGDPLDELGWWDLLPDLADRTSRMATFALLRAQGRALASSPALAALLAQPFLELTGHEPGSVVATVRRRSARHGVAHLVLGDVAGRALLVDRPGEGVGLVDAGRVTLRPVDLTGHLAAHTVTFDAADWGLVLGEDDALAPRARSLQLGRLASSLEILGAAETALAVAVAYAGTREQFGRPIGTFQAVRHLLAWAQTDCVALENVAVTAVGLDESATPPRHDEVVKALAGRNGRRICERALQVLGGIGFTAEHDHHHYHSRVLTFDALLGSSAELTHALGSWVRETRADLAVPAAALLASTD